MGLLIISGARANKQVSHSLAILTFQMKEVGMFSELLSLACAVVGVRGRGRTLSSNAIVLAFKPLSILKKLPNLKGIRAASSWFIACRVRGPLYPFM